MSDDLLGRVSGGLDLSMSEMSMAIDEIMKGRWKDGQIALLLTALHQKGETVDEIAGAAKAMRRHMTRIRSDHDSLLDTCGTGGDVSGTFNISTAAALVTAAAGVPVAKHGNRRVTSRTGSADVLAELGVNIEASVTQSERCLNEVGICFCFAPLMHQSMRHVSAVRKKLGIRTIFNLLGPLCNPADAGFQLLGVGGDQFRPLLAEALRKLGTVHSVVVCGEDGLDEVTLTGGTNCTEIVDDQTREFSWCPGDFELQTAVDLSALQVHDAEGSAEMIRQILNNSHGAPRDIVVLNSAAALWTAGIETTPDACARVADEAISSGAAAETLRRLAEVSQA